MKIIYVILSDNSGEHLCYKPDIIKSWIIPSINQCHQLNPTCEIIMLSDDLTLENDLPFVKFYNANDYIDDDIIWFKDNYIHLSLNQYNFERNAILRFMLLKSFCVSNNINKFLHLEPDVLVYSDVIEDSIFFKDYNVTLLHGIAAGCCFFNNAINVLNDFVTYIRNTYSSPQIIPCGFNMEEEKIRFDNNVRNKTGAGGVSDMHFWSLYRYLHESTSFEQMDKNHNGIFYQTCMIDQKQDGVWKTIIDDNIEIKKLDISNNNCYGTFNDKVIMIKYLHCHGHSKLLIPKYITK